MQLKDVQGHLYNVRNVRVRFSEVSPEPIPDSKLRINLGEAVQETQDRVAGVVHIGDVSTMGEYGVSVGQGGWSGSYR